MTRQGHPFIETRHGERVRIHECVLEPDHEYPCKCWCGLLGRFNYQDAVQCREAWGGSPCNGHSQRRAP